MENDIQVLVDPLRKCRNCERELPATKQYFYQHSRCKDGLTRTCKACSSQKNDEAFRKRKAREPERIAAQARERARKHYYKNLEKSRESSRRSAAKARQDPEKMAKIRMRKRGDGAGLTVEQFEKLFDEQGRLCAICQSKQPGGSVGWNIDHCHKTRKVRFILCCHCNRGLGAFKDDPETMRKAAALLEGFYDNKPT
jgi:hypothetical protein